MRWFPLLILASACARPPTQPVDHTTVRLASTPDACPLGVPHTHVAVAEEGSVLRVSFTTSPPQLEDLRQRVRDQANLNGWERHRGRGHAGQHDGMRNHGLRLWALDRATTAVEDTPAGADLLVRPLERPAENRNALVRRVATLEAAGCP